MGNVNSYDSLLYHMMFYTDLTYDILYKQCHENKE